MALITTADLAPYINNYRSAWAMRAGVAVPKAVARLEALAKEASATAAYDIFLSHKFSDADQLAALYDLLRALGYSVYVDWKEDPALDRGQVTSATAALLRGRMSACRCLFFATTTSSSDSRWMPWELGYKDGQNGRAAICPVVADGGTTFQGQEYLGIYPYVDKTSQTLYIHRSARSYLRFTDWLSGKAFPD